MPNPHETWSTLLHHEVLILIKFHDHKAKIVELLVIGTFGKYSRNFFGKSFMYQNQQFSYQRNGELPVQQVNYGQGQPKSKQNYHRNKKKSSKNNQQRSYVLQQQQRRKSNFTQTSHKSS